MCANRLGNPNTNTNTDTNSNRLGDPNKEDSLKDLCEAEASRTDECAAGVRRTRVLLLKREAGEAETYTARLLRARRLEKCRIPSIQISSTPPRQKRCAIFVEFLQKKFPILPKN